MVILLVCGMNFKQHSLNKDGDEVIEELKKLDHFDGWTI